MIDTVLVFLKNQLKDYLKLKTGADEKVHILNLTDNTGKTIARDLTLTLVNIEEERSLKNQNPYVESESGQFAKVSPPVHVNLYILVSANFGDKETDYQESLKFLSHAAIFFQKRPVYTPKNAPALDPRIGKLTVTLNSLSLESRNDLWSTMGTRYLPSLLYRAGLVPLQEEEILMEVPPVTEANLIM